MLKFNIKLITIFTAYLLFFWDAGFSIGSVTVPFAPFFVIIVLILYFFNDPKGFIKNLILLYKTTPFKYFCWFVIWAIFSPLLFGQIYAFPYILYRVTRAFIVFSLPVIILCTYIPHKKIPNIFFNIYLFIIIYGVIQYVGDLYNIVPLQKIYKIFSYCTEFNASNNPFASFNIVNIIRAKSIFFEPSIFASFLFVCLPYTYSLCSSKLKIINNKKLDLAFKFFIIFLNWLDIFLTKSPIYLCFSVIYTIIFFYKKFIKFSPFILSFCALFIIWFNQATDDFIEENYQLKRINKVLESISDIYTLIEKEPSLGTRIVSIVNTTIASKDYIIAGTGYGNAKNVMHSQYSRSPLPLTLEIQQKCFILNVADGVPTNIFFSILIHTGIVGLFLLYLFFIMCIYKTKQLKFLLKPKEFQFVQSITLACINYLIINFYWSLTRDLFMWFIFGILNSYILQHYKLKNIQTRSIKSEP